MSSRSRQNWSRRSAVSRSAISASWQGKNGQPLHTSPYQAPARLSLVTTSKPDGMVSTVIGWPRPPCVRVSVLTAVCQKHQPIVVAVAYRVVRWDAPIGVKYPVIVAASLVLTVAAYDLLVRRTRVTRFLFGMRG